MRVTVQQLSMIGGKAALDNMNSVITGLNVYGSRAGLDVPHRLAHYITQLCVESGAFKYDEELASGKAYEGRKDLGNTEPGDGVKYKGRGPIQITGRANYTAFMDWCKNKGLNPPDFVRDPHLINVDPWEGLVPVWYWSTRNLNKYADENNIEMIRRRVNGGLNGFDDCLVYYTRVALILLGRPADGVKGFQIWAQEQGLLPAGESQVDGVSGPQTRTALHKALVRLGGQQVAEAGIEVKSAPVVEEKIVVAEGSTKRGWLWGPLAGISGSGLINTFADFPWQYKLAISVFAFALVVVMLIIGERIIRRAKALVSEALK